MSAESRAELMRLISQLGAPHKPQSVRTQDGRQTTAWIEWLDTVSGSVERISVTRASAAECEAMILDAARGAVERLAR